MKEFCALKAKTYAFLLDDNKESQGHKEICNKKRVYF